jgi:hypothetical protein
MPSEQVSRRDASPPFLQSDNELYWQSSGRTKFTPAGFQRRGSKPEVGKLYNLSLDS